MIILGAKGFAKEVLEVIHQLGQTNELVFYDDVNEDIPDEIYDKFKVLKTEEQAKNYFMLIDNKFTIGIGNPVLRKKMSEKFSALGGVLSSTISPLAQVGHYGNQIGKGSNIMTGVVITNDVIIQEGVLINLNCTIGHDSIIGDYVEMSPGVHISGNCKIGDYCVIGTNASVLPRVVLGKNVVVGAGAVVTKDVPDNSLVIGIPAVIKKELPKLEF